MLFLRIISKINDFQSVKSFNFGNLIKNSKFLIFSSFKSLYKINKNLRFIIFNPGRINTILVQMFFC